jgi:hypothetical protein
MNYGQHRYPASYIDGLSMNRGNVSESSPHCSSQKVSPSSFQSVLKRQQSLGYAQPNLNSQRTNESSAVFVDYQPLPGKIVPIELQYSSQDYHAQLKRVTRQQEQRRS